MELNRALINLSKAVDDYDRANLTETDQRNQSKVNELFGRVKQHLVAINQATSVKPNLTASIAGSDPELVKLSLNNSKLELRKFLEEFLSGSDILCQFNNDSKSTPSLNQFVDKVVTGVNCFFRSLRHVINSIRFTGQTRPKDTEPFARQCNVDQSLLNGLITIARNYLQSSIDLVQGLDSKTLKTQHEEIPNSFPVSD